MAKKAKAFFPRSNKETKPEDTKEEKKEYITWGAAWMYFHEGTNNEDEGELPYFSIRIDKEGLDRMVEYAKTTEDGNINCMMFSNRNPREGDEYNDPHYYLVPPRDTRE